MPSMCDVHVHFREPGQSYKETVKTGSLAAAKGGYTVVCTMPNLTPPPHDMKTLQTELDIIRKDAIIKVMPYGTITDGRKGCGSLSDMAGMASSVIAFSDDGTGVQDSGLMRYAMAAAKELGKVIVAHCEDESLLACGKIRESEWKQIERDLRLADETGCAYHVCHISCAESVEIIREAKKSGVDVTCETAPHYLMLDGDDVKKRINACPEKGGAFKMNPPIKEPKDRAALLRGISDATIDMIATDHAPHSEEEKSRGFDGSLNGITGLECAFPVLYTGLVKTGIINIEKLIELMAVSPRRRFEIPETEDFVITDLEHPFNIRSSEFVSMGKCTPFDGMKVYGKILMTVCDGRIVYEDSGENYA